MSLDLSQDLLELHLKDQPASIVLGSPPLTHEFSVGAEVQAVRNAMDMAAESATMTKVEATISSTAAVVIIPVDTGWATQEGRGGREKLPGDTLWNRT